MRGKDIGRLTTKWRHLSTTVLFDMSSTRGERSASCTSSISKQESYTSYRYTTRGHRTDAQRLHRAPQASGLSSKAELEWQPLPSVRRGEPRWRPSALTSSLGGRKHVCPKSNSHVEQTSHVKRSLGSSVRRPMSVLKSSNALQMRSERRSRTSLSPPARSVSTIASSLVVLPRRAGTMLTRAISCSPSMRQLGAPQGARSSASVVGGRALCRTEIVTRNGAPYGYVGAAAAAVPSPG
jgi:hypothetical protein